MKVALYARVSSEGQAARGTIDSQVEALRAAIAKEDHEVVAEYIDDGYSGARLDRPGLDALRDAAEAGKIEAVFCLTPDRLARSFAYQTLVLDELARFGVAVRFLDAPPIDNDPQARLLVQMQGVIAEYENYPNVWITLVMPTAPLSRTSLGVAWPAWRSAFGVRHNHRLSRKASRESVGR